MRRTTLLHFPGRANKIGTNRSQGQDTESNFERLIFGYFVGNHLQAGARYTMIRNDAKTADGLGDMTLVEFVELPFELWDVVVTCEDPTPRP